MFSHLLSYKYELIKIYNNSLCIIFIDILNNYFKNEQNYNTDIKQRYLQAYHVGGLFNHLMFWFSHNMKDEAKVFTQMAMDIFPMNFKPYLSKKKFLV